MKDQPIHYLDIATLGRYYREKKLSPVEVTKGVLTRIETLDERLNAFITVLQDQAMTQAKQAEQDFQNEIDQGPLQGIPISVKDIFDTAGIRTTSASPQWMDRVPDVTATSVQRLLDAGAILLGKCNLLEFAYGIVHPDFGQCNNPWDTNRTSGGSSSGSAASVAAGMGWGSLGTDTGGSIRIPASYCGLVGLKPTYGRVSKHGVFPLSWSLDHVGTLTRTVEDTAIILGTIAGYDPLDPSTSRLPVPNYRETLKRDLNGVTIGVLEHHMDHADLHHGVAEVTRTAVKELEKLGASLQMVKIPSIDMADPALLMAILPEGTVAHEKMLREHPELYAEMTRQQLELGALIPAVDYIRANQYRTKLLGEFLEVFKDVDVIVSPTVAFEAPAEDPVVAAGEGSDEARRTGPTNLTGLPSISVPCGFGKDGMPLGLHITAPPMSDSLVLDVAYAYEQQTSWHTRHPDLIP